MDQRELLHHGYLRKSPPYEKILKNYKWHKRYFKLWSDRTLEYYKKSNKVKPLNEPIDLKYCTGVHDNYPEYEKYFSKNYKWHFCLNMPNRQYHFLARSKEERNEWVEMLTKVWKSVSESNNQLFVSTILTEIRHSSSNLQDSNFSDFMNDYDELPQIRQSYVNAEPMPNSPNFTHSLIYPDDEKIDVSNYDFLPPAIPINMQVDNADGCHFNADNYNKLPPPVPFTGLNLTNPTESDGSMMANNEMNLLNYNSLPPPVLAVNVYKNAFKDLENVEHDLVNFPPIDNHATFIKSIKQQSTRRKPDEDFSETLNTSGYVPMDHIPIECLKTNEPEEYIKIAESTKLTAISPAKEFKKFKCQPLTNGASSANLNSPTLSSSHLDHIPVVKSKHIESLKISESGTLSVQDQIMKTGTPPAIHRETKPLPAFDRSIKPIFLVKKLCTDSSYDYVCPKGSKYLNGNLDSSKFSILDEQQQDNEYLSMADSSFEKEKKSFDLVTTHNDRFENFLANTLPLNNNVLNNHSQKYSNSYSLPDYQSVKSKVNNSNEVKVGEVSNCSPNKFYQAKSCDKEININGNNKSTDGDRIYENVKAKSTATLYENNNLTYVSCSYDDTKLAHPKVEVQLSRYTAVDTEKSEALKNIR